MKIKAFELRIHTQEGLYGSRCNFRDRLNIIRGNNSSGKSTLVNCLLYSIGMEELIGGKNLASLTSAVTESFKFEGREIAVEHSETLVEIENGFGQVVTIRRPIKASTQDPRLVQVIDGAALTSPNFNYQSTDKYLHDKGSAYLNEGYYLFLSRFLGLALPKVANNAGSEVPLYIQTVFSAMIVEQKRGWSDYLANCPYYGIKDNKTKVIEFLLNLDVFQNDLERSRLNNESIRINEKWQRLLTKLDSESRSIGAYIEGVPTTPKATFSREVASIWKVSSPENIPLQKYVDAIRAQLLDIETQGGDKPEKNDILEKHLTQLQKLSLRFESISGALAIQRSSLAAVSKLESDTSEELNRNKTVQKLRKLGGEQNLATANDKCPTCLQSLNESLLATEVFGPQMDIEQNIKYQEQQASMLNRQIDAIKSDITRLELTEKEIGAQISRERDLISQIRLDLRSNETISRTAIRQQMLLEDIQRRAEATLELFDKSISEFSELAQMQHANAEARGALPKEDYSATDLGKIGIFEKNFRANASSFDYQSVEPHKIKIGLGNLLPHLEDIELKSIYSKLRADSSASDFIRLIWSFDLALFQASKMKAVSGNHPGFILFDEPAQHSMGENALRSLLQQLAATDGLQSIVAASFEESDHSFKQATTNIEFHLIRIDANSRSIAPGPALLDIEEN